MVVVRFFLSVVRVDVFQEWAAAVQAAGALSGAQVAEAAVKRKVITVHQVAEAEEEGQPLFLQVQALRAILSFKSAVEAAEAAVEAILVQ